MNDYELRDMIFETLERSLDFNLNNISMTVKDGHLHLAGFVENSEQKRQLLKEISRFEEIKIVSEKIEQRHPFGGIFPLGENKKQNGLVNNRTELI